MRGTGSIAPAYSARNERAGAAHKQTFKTLATVWWVQIALCSTPGWVLALSLVWATELAVRLVYRMPAMEQRAGRTALGYNANAASFGRATPGGQMRGC